jgi:hypothetical protein
MSATTMAVATRTETPEPPVSRPVQGAVPASDAVIWVLKPQASSLVGGIVQIASVNSSRVNKG